MADNERIHINGGLHSLLDEHNIHISHSYDSSGSFPSAPRKPVILAGNALQLELDDSEPDTPYAPEPVLVEPYLSDSAETSPTRAADHPAAPAPADHPANPAPTPADPRPLARVRFRSRVRITSGLRHHRAPSADSSGSGSPSSSISAPLRAHADDAHPRGPLGQRLSLLAASAWQKRRLATAVAQNEVAHAHQPPAIAQPDERTPLVQGRRSRQILGTSTGELDETMSEEDEEDEEAYLAELRDEEENIAFGRWPWRVFNKHWWAWQMENSSCCTCSDEYDAEE